MPADWQLFVFLFTAELTHSRVYLLVRPFRSPRKLSTKSTCEASFVGGDQVKPSDLLAPKKSLAVRPSDLLTASKQLIAAHSVVGATRSAGQYRRGRRLNVTATELSDVHKQKLRGAVLTALEEEGIKMKD
ncbi:hypothetical protein FHG87_025206, partial [Trinorchestia longiramus]